MNKSYSLAETFHLRICGKRVLFLLAVLIFMFPEVTSAQQSYKTPQDVADALVNAVRSGNRKSLLKVLGPSGAGIISSGDDVADATARRKFVATYDTKHKITMDGDNKAIMVIGDEEFPFPIPIVRKGETWRLDTAAGRQELLYRRVGRNELSTIQACLAYVDAQNEYAEKDRTGAGKGTYAQRVVSQPGKKDGLYWPTSQGEEASPLGELVAQATAEGYRIGGKRLPFHGYYFRILTKQGPHAPGGALDYSVRGRMIGGFALLAYPAQYGYSGVMTFLVNHAGIVYQKDLGPGTAKLAEKMTTYDPDQTWKKASDVTPP